MKRKSKAEEESLEARKKWKSFIPEDGVDECSSIGKKRNVREEKGEIFDSGYLEEDPQLTTRRRKQKKVIFQKNFINEEDEETPPPPPPRKEKEEEKSKKSRKRSRDFLQMETILEFREQKKRQDPDSNISDLNSSLSSLASSPSKEKENSFSFHSPSYEEGKSKENLALWEVQLELEEVQLQLDEIDMQMKHSIFLS